MIYLDWIDLDLLDTFESEEELQEIKNIVAGLDVGATEDVRVIAEVDYNNSDAEANQ